MLPPGLSITRPLLLVDRRMELAVSQHRKSWWKKWLNWRNPPQIRPERFHLRQSVFWIRIRASSSDILCSEKQINCRSMVRSFRRSGEASVRLEHLYFQTPLLNSYNSPLDLRAARRPRGIISAVTSRKLEAEKGDNLKWWLQSLSVFLERPLKLVLWVANKWWRLRFLCWLFQVVQGAYHVDSVPALHRQREWLQLAFIVSSEALCFSVPQALL